MGREFDFILAGATLIVSIMLLTGHGDIFLKGGNADVRKKNYDEPKMAKALGVALLLTGVGTFIDSFTTSFASAIGYMIFLVVIYGGLYWYIKKKCKKQ